VITCSIFFRTSANVALGALRPYSKGRLYSLGLATMRNSMRHLFVLRFPILRLPILRLPILRLTRLHLSILHLSILCLSMLSINTSWASQAAEPNYNALLTNAYWFSSAEELNYAGAQRRFNTTTTQINDRYLHLKETTHYYWVQQTISTKNQTQAKRWHLVLDRQYPQFDQVDVYLATEWGAPERFQQSDRLTVEGSSAPPRMMAFAINLEPNKIYKVTLVIKSRAQQPIALELMEPDNFYQSVKNTEFAWGLFYGIFIVTAIFNLFIFLALRQNLYLYYVAHVTAIAFTQAGISTHGAYYLWGSTSQWSQISHVFFVGLAMVFGVLFARPFISSKKLTPTLDKWLIAMLPVGACISLGALVLPYNIIISLTDVSLAVLSVLMITASSIAWKSGRKTARFFLLGWGTLLGCTLIYILTLRGIFSPNMFTLHAAQFGIIAEILIITVAIGDRIQQHQQEKRWALLKQKMAIDALKEAEATLTYRAYHDKITGLPNRDKLIDVINDELVAQQRGSEKVLYIALIKIKRLREINHTLGHYVGDMVAKTTSQALNNLLRKLPKNTSIAFNEEKREYLSAIQGVNLSFLLSLDKDEDGAAIIIEMLNQLPQQFQFESISLDMSTSCGICHAPDHGQDPETLLRNAFVAVEEAQTHGRLYCMYDESVNPYSERRLSLMGDLCKAIDGDHLELYLHPQLETKSMEIISAEALLRWNHDQYGFIPPDEFVQLAESSGAIKPLTRWVIRNSFALLRKLHDQNYMIGISINISAHNLEEADLTDYLIAQLAHYSIAPEHVTLEVTETAMVMNPERAHEVLVRWNEIGFATSIDDYGTGYSSLSHLKKLPMNELKIDRSFITDMQKSDDDIIIVQSTLDISHNMKMRVVAEGVETEEIMNALIDMGCDIIQGYLLTPPLGIDRFIEWMDTYKYPVKGRQAPTSLHSIENSPNPPLRKA